MTFSIENLEGVATTPLLKICLGKTLRRTRVKEIHRFSNLNFMNIPKINRSTRPHFKASWPGPPGNSPVRTGSKIKPCCSTHFKDKYVCKRIVSKIQGFILNTTIHSSHWKTRICYCTRIDFEIIQKFRIGN